jgi:hypothetical protein
MSDEDEKRKRPRIGVFNARREELDVSSRFTLDMSDNASKALIADAKAKAKVATSTFATPARQESVRVGLVIAAVIALPIVGKLLQIESVIILAGMTVVGGIYGVPKAIEKWRQPKAILPPSPEERAELVR